MRHHHLDLLGRQVEAHRAVPAKGDQSLDEWQFQEHHAVVAAERRALDLPPAVRIDGWVRLGRPSRDVAGVGRVDQQRWAAVAHQIDALVAHQPQAGRDPGRVHVVGGREVVAAEGVEVDVLAVAPEPALVQLVKGRAALGGSLAVLEQLPHQRQVEVQSHRGVLLEHPFRPASPARVATARPRAPGRARPAQRLARPFTVVRPDRACGRRSPPYPFPPSSGRKDSRSSSRLMAISTSVSPVSSMTTRREAS